MKKCNHVAAIEKVTDDGLFFVYRSSVCKIGDHAEIFNFCPKRGEPIKRKKTWTGKQIK